MYNEHVIMYFSIYLGEKFRIIAKPVLYTVPFREFFFYTRVVRHKWCLLLLFLVSFPNTEECEDRSAC